MDKRTLNERLEGALETVARQNDLLREALECIEEYGEKIEELKKTHREQMQKMFDKLKNK